MHCGVPAVVLVALVFPTVVAQPAGADAAKGSQLAQQWCSNCHVTNANPATNVQQGPPSFALIARARTADQLRTFLSHPHGAMPDLSLTRMEIDDLVGYIESLR